MATINFGGLATGMDTNAIIKAIMDAERQPITRLQRDKEFYQNRLTAFQGFETKLKDLLSKAEKLDTAKELVVNKANLSGEGYLKVQADPQAAAGTYGVEVVSLARQEKEVSGGVAAGWTTAGGDVTINGQVIAIAAGSTIEQIRDAINANPDVGITASLINDGTVTPNRLVLTADTAGANGVDITANTLDIAFNMTQAGSQAHVKIDNIDIYSNSNSLTGAIPGVTIDLLKENVVPGETTTLSVSRDNDAIKGQIEGFVKAFNAVLSFVKDQSGSSWSADPAFRSAHGRLRGLLVSSVGGSGAFQTLASLGFKTQKEDGSLAIDSQKLTEAISSDMDSVVKLFAGEAGIDGVAKKFQTYLKDITGSTDGIYASKRESTGRNVRQIDRQVERLEARLSQREASLRARFEAMETLVGGLNSQGAFLSQQMVMMSNTWSQR